MKTILAETVYRHVPVQQQERLLAFRAAHPLQQIDLGGTVWSYLVGGEGTETFLLLPGGERRGDIGFPLLQEFEQEYRCLYPAFPPYSTMDALLTGLAALLDRLSITQAILFGASFGGDVAQCFVRKYPDRVSKLILANTGIPDERLGKATIRGRQLLTRLPLGLVYFLEVRLLEKALVVRPEERLFWRAMLREMIGQLTLTEMVSTFDETIDYRLNYHFSPDDLAGWPGQILILQSDDDLATKPAMRQALRDLYPRAQVQTFQHAGHVPALSQPDTFYRVVRAFLRQ